jgi:hypothetical protein
VRTELGLRLPNGKADYATAKSLLSLSFMKDLRF